jgi:hypothetical protein
MLFSILYNNGKCQKNVKKKMSEDVYITVTLKIKYSDQDTGSTTLSSTEKDYLRSL